MVLAPKKKRSYRRQIHKMGGKNIALAPYLLTRCAVTAFGSKTVCGLCAGPLLTELSEKRTQQSIIRVELTTHATEKIEFAAVGLDDMLGTKGAGFANYWRTAPFFSKFGQVNDKIFPSPGLS